MSKIKTHYHDILNQTFEGLKETYEIMGKSKRDDGRKHFEVEYKMGRVSPAVASITAKCRVLAHNKDDAIVMMLEKKISSGILRKRISIIKVEEVDPNEYWDNYDYNEDPKNLRGDLDEEQGTE